MDRRLWRARVRPAPHAGGPPVHLDDFPDPWVVRVGAAYYAYATQSGGMNVPVLRSPDLRRWERAGDALPIVYPWATAGRTWSPAVLPRGDDFVLYHVVREPISGLQCIAAAGATRPEGPFADLVGGPFVFQRERGGSIDPSVFVDDDDRAYLLWKSDDNALGQAPSLWGQPLSADGRTLTGRPTELLRHDRAWERPLVEAPSMVRSEGTCFLFYSANWWESERYGIGYATARSPLGPFRKVTTKGPWMGSGVDAAGPGGQEFFADAAGALRMAYHAWAPGAATYAGGGRRSLRIARIGFLDGSPVVM